MTDAVYIEDLHKIYANNIVALKGINLKVKQGDFYALLGPNGAGKSTTIGILNSLVKKTRGVVKIFDYDIDQDFPRAKLNIGVVPQEYNFNIFEKVFHILIQQGGFYGLNYKTAHERTEKYLTKLELWDKRNHKVQHLSGGMKRRLMIARALIHEPRLLILDEPTAGVDIEIRRTMWDFLREINQQGTSVILTTHYLEEAELLCNNIGIIDNGVLIENTSMKSLLQKLNRETFVLYLKNPLKFPPEIEGFNARLIDETTLEIDVYQDQDLNKMFDLLDQHAIVVNSLRNKVNRLEELFLGIIHKSSEAV